MVKLGRPVLHKRLAGYSPGRVFVADHGRLRVQGKSDTDAPCSASRSPHSGSTCFAARISIGSATRACQLRLGKPFGSFFQSYNLFLFRKRPPKNVEVPGPFYAGLPRAERTRRALGITHRPGPGRAPFKQAQPLSGRDQQQTGIHCPCFDERRPRIILPIEPTGALDSQSWPRTYWHCSSNYPPARAKTVHHHTHDAEGWPKPCPNG